jgi:hypothetical protein
MSIVNNLKNKRKLKKNNRYEVQLNRLRSQDFSTKSIEKTVNQSVENIKNGARSFAVYGEPQSGKTEMMIALTAKLLDEGFQIIIHLVNDNVELKDQNLQRLSASKITPSPKDYTEVIPPQVNIGKKQWIIFCKKNSNNLRDLLEKIDNIKGKIIIDDEADYASPNSKINQGKQSTINELVDKLIDDGAIYIGVTATPDRLHLNNTFNNDPSNWVFFEPHTAYQGKDYFFPLDLKNASKDKEFQLNFYLKLLEEDANPDEYIENAALRFIVNASFLNCKVYKDNEKGFTMLIHTAGQTFKHDEDLIIVQNLINILSDEENKQHDKYWTKIEQIAMNEYPDDVEDLLDYALDNIGRHTTVLMNSKNKNTSYKAAIEPINPYTFAFGGNIISRGLTFNNLLSMFFTRKALHIQADTYIQRARMFGARGSLANYFELHIPEELYDQWWKCFFLNRLSVQSIQNGYDVPIAIGSSVDKVRPVAPSSIDKMFVDTKKGEISWEIFDYTNEIINIENKLTLSTLDRLKLLNTLLGSECLPKYILDIIQQKFTSPDGDESIVLHSGTSIANYKSGTDQENISRPKQFMGAWDLERNKYPKAVHHFKILFNANNKARIFYKFDGKGFTYLSNLKNKKIIGPIFKQPNFTKTIR